MQIRLVEDLSGVEAALESIDEPLVGVDVERADGDRYFRAAALVQVGVDGRCVLLDGLVLGELLGLDRFLQDRVAVFHALENDLAPLESANVHLGSVTDTAVAAAMLGLPTGLGPLLDAVLGIQLPENKERLQRADWAARPLTDEMITYAAGDVVHLPALWNELDRRLQEAGRRRWYEQELEATRERARDGRRSWTRIKGLGRLDGRGRAVLRELWEERESIATSEDAAPQRVARDETLVAIAENPPHTVSGLAARGLRRAQTRLYGDRLLAAVRRGQSAPDQPSPFGLRRSTDHDRATYARLRRARARIAGELGLEAGVLAPGRRLWHAVLSDPEDAAQLCEIAGMRPWQAEVLADALWEAYLGAAGGDGEVVVRDPSVTGDAAIDVPTAEDTTSIG